MKPGAATVPGFLMAVRLDIRNVRFPDSGFSQAWIIASAAVIFEFLFESMA